MNELDKLIDLLKAAVAAGQTFTLSADDVNISLSKDGGVDVTINAPMISTES